MSAARTILIIEDEPAMVMGLVDALSFEGYRAVAASNGKQGVELARAERPDLVLLDLMLPGISGTEVCRSIRQRSSVPVIMLTAKDSEIDKVVGLELGEDPGSDALDRSRVL